MNIWKEARLLHKNTGLGGLETNGAPDPEEFGSCGLAGGVSLNGIRSNDLLMAAVEAVRRMHYRSGVNLDDNGEVMGADGAGVLMDIDREAWGEMLTDQQRRGNPDWEERLNVGMFQFEDSNLVGGTRAQIEAIMHRYGMQPLGWRKVEVAKGVVNEKREARMPEYGQLLFLTGEGDSPVDAAKRIYTAARRIDQKMRHVRIGSLAPGQVVYKAVVTGDELGRLFPDFEHLEASRVIGHGRFSTNVATSHELAQPFGYLGHNGEINTHIAVKRALYDLGQKFGFTNEVLMAGGSDSAHLNDAVGFMLANGVSLPEAMMRLMPPALAKLSGDSRKFFEASKRAMGTFGTWEGPAAVLSFDEQHFNARVDKQGFRPMSWAEILTNGDRWMTFGSEKGVFDAPFDEIVRTGQLSAGESLVVKLVNGEVLVGNQVIDHVMESSGLNWEELTENGLLVPSSYAKKAPTVKPLKLSAREVKGNENLMAEMAGYGWTFEDLKHAVERINAGKPVIYSMGIHRPLGILDPKLSSIYDLFLQKAAIITNPPIDPLGEPDVIEAQVSLGGMPHIDATSKEYDPIYPQWNLDSAIIPVDDLDEIIRASDESRINLKIEAPRVWKIDATYDGDDLGGFEERIDAISQSVIDAAKNQNGDAPAIIVFSDRAAFSEGTDGMKLPIPPVLILLKARTALAKEGLSRDVSLVCDTGTVRHGHDAGVLIAHGAEGVCPFVLDRIAKMSNDPKQALHNLYTAENKELVKMMAKLGISSSLGVENGFWFSAVGIAPEVVRFGGAKTTSKIRGLDSGGIFRNLVLTQGQRFKEYGQWMEETSERELDKQGAYVTEIRSLFNFAAFPDRVKMKKFLNEEEAPQLYSNEDLSDEQLSAIAYRFASERLDGLILNLRDCLKVNYQVEEGAVTPEMLSKAPSAESILKRIFQSHMSLGALSPEAHAGIARGFNKVGAQSASGEGGEEPERSRDGSRPLDRSHARQIGTAGWGVDLKYLMEADELCIKIAQGAKPGEGGDLPGAKVTEFIAELRHVKVGTRLISPPPNHDIYSIEDLKARIRAFRALNPKANISIKVASMPGLGQIAVGAVKAGTDVLEVSGFDAGTGAAGKQSLKYTGLPVEIGLAEVHQALVGAGLRHRVQLRADGKMSKPEDFIKMLAMGADGIGLGTLAMLWVNCIACKSCHTNKCPTGITTQNQKLRDKTFVRGEEPEGILRATQDNVQEFLIELGSQGVERGLLTMTRSIQYLCARMGITEENFDQLVGNVDLLSQKDTGNEVIDSLQLDAALLRPVGNFNVMGVDNLRESSAALTRDVIEFSLGQQLVNDAVMFLSGEVDTLRLRDKYELVNTDREFGVQLAGEIYDKLMRVGKMTNDKRITIETEGFGGHAYGFAISDGITLEHEGFLNDSVGQYMSGNAKITVEAHEDMPNREGQAILGNQAGMCASGGTLYCGGKAGTRFGVRNSGAVMVAEGALDYPFEYMTSGEGILLGDFPGMICSRMTGGKVLIYDPSGVRRQRIADEYVELVEMGDDDYEKLKARLIDFHSDVDSVVAEKILADWDNEKQHFAMILPRD